METLFPRVFETLLPTLAASTRQQRGQPGGVEEGSGRTNLKIWTIVSQRMSDNDVYAPLPPVSLKPAAEFLGSLAMDESSVGQDILGLADRVKPKSGSAATLLLDWSLSCTDESLRSKEILECCRDIQNEYTFRMEILEPSCMEKEHNRSNLLEHLLAQFDEEEFLTNKQVENKDEVKDIMHEPDDLSCDSAKNKQSEMISMLSKVASRKADGCEDTIESSDLSLPRLEAGVHEKIFQPPNEILQLVLSIRNEICSFLSQSLPWEEAAQFNGLVVGETELIHAAEQACLGKSPEKQVTQELFAHVKYMADFAFHLVHRGLHQAFVHYNKGCLGQMSGNVISGMERLGSMVEALEINDSPKHSLLKQALVTVATTIPDARQLIIADQASFVNLYGVIQGCHLSVFQYSTYHGSKNVIENMEVDCFLVSVAEMKSYLETGANALDLSPFAHVVVYESDTCVQQFLVDMIGPRSIPITLLRTNLEVLLGDEVKMQVSATKPEIFVENQHSTVAMEPGIQFHEMECNHFDTRRDDSMAMGVPIWGSFGLSPPYMQAFQMPPPINCLSADAGIPLQQAWGGVAPHFVDNMYSLHRNDMYLNQEVDMSRSFESISQPFRVETGFVEPQILTSPYMLGEDRKPRMHMERHHPMYQPSKNLFEVQEGQRKDLYPYAPPNSPQHFGENGLGPELEINGQYSYRMNANHSYPHYDHFVSYNGCYSRPNNIGGLEDRLTEGFGAELSQTADHKSNHETLYNKSLFDELPDKPFVLNESRFKSAPDSIVDNPIQKLESLYESMRKPKRPRGRGEGFTSRCLQR